MHSYMHHAYSQRASLGVEECLPLFCLTATNLSKISSSYIAEKITILLKVDDIYFVKRSTILFKSNLLRMYAMHIHSYQDSR